MAQGLEFSPQNPRFRKLDVVRHTCAITTGVWGGEKERQDGTMGRDEAPVYLWYFVAGQPGLIDEPQVPVRDIVLIIQGLFCFK